MGKKLLVADDSITIQKVIKLALSSEGYEILAVSGGKDVMQTAEQERPDVILIDVSLPGKDAYEIKRMVNSTPALSGIRFVLMYSAFEKVDEHQAVEVGFDARLIKPFDPSNLRKIIAGLVGASSVATQLSPPKAEPLVVSDISLAEPPVQAQAVNTIPEASEDLPPVMDIDRKSVV